jgi:biotin-(acetyl-CoA carboxylase) ligase
MKNVYDELISTVNDFYSKYQDLDNEITSKRPAADTWTPKEIIGHLIDSASNNHQRFIRLQIVDELIFPGYGKDNSKWLEITKYNEMNFADIILLWKQYNILIGNIIKVADESKLGNRWENAEGDNKALRDLMIDYVRHLKDHLQHFEETLREINR